MSIRTDIEAARRRDPAARSAIEVALTYPGLHAVWSYRVSHRMWEAGFKFAARVLAQVTRALTGVEIHPGAHIGKRLFIDHGMGVVIGQTAEIGDDVTMYHGVTLGGTTWQAIKRHPTVGDRVLIGANATLLGAITIGADSVIAAGAVVVRDAPAHSRLRGTPATVEPRDPTEAAEYNWVI